MKKLLLYFSLMCHTLCFAQNQGISNIWLMGYTSWAGAPFGQSKFDFYTGVRVTTLDSLEMDFNHTHANISDSNGNLLFYTNGYYIADATNDTMQNGSGINPSAFTNYVSDGMFIPQENLILNRSGNTIIYDLFHGTLDNWPSSTAVLSYHLYHSVIDMSLNSGLGAVILKNQIIINDSLIPGKVVACKHANGVDWWVICFRSHSNKIYKLLVEPNGNISISNQNTGFFRANFYGQAKFSSDGRKFIVFNPNYPSTGMLEIFDFDRCTGILSNPDSISIPPTYGFNCGVEFSPNSNCLYVTTGDSIYQFDVSATNVASTKITVAGYDGFYQPGFPSFQVGLCQPQLAPDGKIYFGSGNSTTYMGTIDNPDVQGLGCNVNQHSVLLPAYNYNTLPNHPNYFLGCDTTGGCICLVGTNEIEKENINVRAAPNPSNGIFTLQFPVQKMSGELEVYDVMGNLVLKDYIAAWSQYKRVDIGKLAKGIYMCKLKWGNTVGSVKVIKE